MKRMQSALLVFCMLFLLTAWGSEANPLQENGGQASNNTLIVYFSRWGNTEYPADVDATTSASIVADGNLRYGTTEYIANMIAGKVGGDLHRIETVTSYTTDFDELRDVNHDEMNRNDLPKLKTSDLDLSAYDTVFVGYPVWATGVPQAVMSFLKDYDLTGKTVIPFCTHDGYGAGSSYQTIAKASHAAVSLKGIAIEAQDAPNAQDTIDAWLTEIGISETNTQTETAIKITIGRVTSDLSVFDNLDSREEITFSLAE
ncbi:MAG: flavodoxin [Lachnospiraceae bacterium]|nr:flavodoxin [Lachnospiraceae bacterium]